MRCGERRHGKTINGHGCAREPRFFFNPPTPTQTTRSSQPEPSSLAPEARVSGEASPRGAWQGRRCPIQRRVRRQFQATDEAHLPRPAPPGPRPALSRGRRWTGAGRWRRLRGGRQRSRRRRRPPTRVRPGRGWKKEPRLKCCGLLEHAPAAPRPPTGPSCPARVPRRRRGRLGLPGVDWQAGRALQPPSSQAKAAARRPRRRQLPHRGAGEPGGGRVGDGRRTRREHRKSNRCRVWRRASGFAFSLRHQAQPGRRVPVGQRGGHGGN